VAPPDASAAADAATKPPPTTSESATPPGAPSPTATGNGRLAVHSSPSGATLTVEGKSHGNTPQTLRDLPLGTYTVQIARSGYGTKTEKVTLTAAKPSADVTITLTQGASKANATKPVPTATASSSAKTGALRVTTRPAGAKVTIDGKAAGITPLSSAGLSA